MNHDIVVSGSVLNKLDFDTYNYPYMFIISFFIDLGKVLFVISSKLYNSIEFNFISLYIQNNIHDSLRISSTTVL